MQSDNLGQVGRIREGRVDTGTPVFQNERSVSAEIIRRALTNAGFSLNDAHRFEQQREGRQKKFVVLLGFGRQDTIAEYNRETTEAFRELAAISWFCHVWRNPNGVLTINFVNIQEGIARQNLTIRDNHVALVSTQDGEPSLLGTSLEGISTVLVKFFFTNPKRIPKGIRRIERKPDAEMDKYHASAVVNSD